MVRVGRLVSVVGAGALLVVAVVGTAPASAASAPPAAPRPSAVVLPAAGDVAVPTSADPFVDVPATHPFATQIGWLAAQGITTGYADGTYHPAEPVSRQAMAAFVYRFAASPHFTAPAVARFVDMPVGAAFYREVMWLASQGVTTGYADGTFRPAAPVSREAMAAFLYRVAGSPAVPAGPAGFSDVPVTYPFFTEISWLAAQGITTGYADGTFRPTEPVSREAMAAFLYRYADHVGVPTLGPPVGNPGDVKNCSDFTTWAQAQAWFDRYYPYYGDVASLDGNGDGIACQSLPGAP